MNTPNAIRLDILSAAVRAIAATLTAEQRNYVDTAVRTAASEVSDRALSPDADAALAAELSLLLAALQYRTGSLGR